MSQQYPPSDWLKERYHALGISDEQWALYGEIYAGSLCMGPAGRPETFLRRWRLRLGRLGRQLRAVAFRGQ